MHKIIKKTVFAGMGALISLAASQGYGMEQNTSLTSKYTKETIDIDGMVEEIIETLKLKNIDAKWIDEALKSDIYQYLQTNLEHFIEDNQRHYQKSLEALTKKAADIFYLKRSRNSPARSLYTTRAAIAEIKNSWKYKQFHSRSAPYKTVTIDKTVEEIIEVLSLENIGGRLTDEATYRNIYHYLQTGLEDFVEENRKYYQKSWEALKEKTVDIFYALT